MQTARALASLALFLLYEPVAGQIISQAASFNPFSGQGAAPDGSNALIPVFPVSTTFALTKLLAVDETVYTFTLRAYWASTLGNPFNRNLVLESSTSL